MFVRKERAESGSAVRILFKGETAGGKEVLKVGLTLVSQWQAD
jgi:hypothetical protein